MRTTETAPFWDACAEGRLVLPQCTRCDTWIWYPRGYCPACSSTDVRWSKVAGTGTVYTFSIVRKGSGAYANAGPYVVAYIELDEGPRIMSNIVGCPVDAVTIGMRVAVVFERAGDGDDALYRFAPDRAAP